MNLIATFLAQADFLAAFWLALGTAVAFDLWAWVLISIPPENKRLWPPTDEELRAEACYGGVICDSSAPSFSGVPRSSRPRVWESQRITVVEDPSVPRDQWEMRRVYMRPGAPAVRPLPQFWKPPTIRSLGVPRD